MLSLKSSKFSLKFTVQFKMLYLRMGKVALVILGFTGFRGDDMQYLLTAEGSDAYRQLVAVMVSKKHQ